MPRAGCEPETPATKRPQTYALDRAATGIGTSAVLPLYNYALDAMVTNDQLSTDHVIKYNEIFMSHRPDD
jgi:hypothetical protein